VGGGAARQPHLQSLECESQPGGVDNYATRGVSAPGGWLASTSQGVSGHMALSKPIAPEPRKADTGAGKMQSQGKATKAPPARGPTKGGMAKVKEVAFSPHIAQHDISVRMRRVRGWLESGLRQDLGASCLLGGRTEGEEGGKRAQQSPSRLSGSSASCTSTRGDSDICSSRPWMSRWRLFSALAAGRAAHCAAFLLTVCRTCSQRVYGARSGQYG
jgi:hypothetical protein